MAVGSQLSQPPVVLINSANAFTQKYFEPILADSIFVPSPTWWRMTRLGHKVTGGALVWPVVTAEELTGGAYFGAQNLDTQASDSAQPAQLEWKFYYQTIAIPYTDWLLNQGPQQVISLIKAKEEIAMASLLQKLSRAQYGTAPQNSSIDLDSIPAALGSLAGTYAGITLAQATNWACNGGAGPTSGGAVSLSAMMTDYMSATQGNEEPDTIITTHNGWSAFWNLLQPLQRYTRDDETTRAGFKNHLMFNNAVVLRDRFVPAGEMEMFTSKYVYPAFHRDDYFTVDPFVKPTNQRVIVSQIFITLNLKFISLRQQARHTGITNA
jgi:hypothetical protein